MSYASSSDFGTGLRAALRVRGALEHPQAHVSNLTLIVRAEPAPAALRGPASALPLLVLRPAA